MVRRRAVRPRRDRGPLACGDPVFAAIGAAIVRPIAANGGYSHRGAEYAGVCRDTIYTACERGELHHLRIGGRRSIRLKREWINQWFERHARQARAGVPTGLAG